MTYHCKLCDTILRSLFLSVAEATSLGGGSGADKRSLHHAQDNLRLLFSVLCISMMASI